VNVDEALRAPETARHLENTVRVWLGLRASEPIACPALPLELARLLLRAEEHERDTRDRWGGWDHTHAESARRGTLGLAELDRWLAARRDEVEPVARLEPRWPSGRRFAVCLTHDVDVLALRSTPAQILRDARAAFAPDGWTPLPLRALRPPVRVARALRRGPTRAPSLRETLERSVELERARGFTASYFFTVPPAGGWTRWDCVYAPEDRCSFRGRVQSVAEVMRTLRGEGFDVGLHGSYRSAVAPGVLSAERTRLEQAIDGDVRTTRQHFLHWDVRRTPGLQESAGLHADSSLGSNRSVGFRAGTSLPFRQYDLAARRPLDLVQVPPAVQDAALLGPIGLRAGTEATRAAVGDLLGEVAGVGGVLTLIFHPDKLLRPDWRSLYEWTLDRVTESGAWVTSVSGLDEWWRDRERAILGA
jgi:hypothetical protein